VAVAQLDQQTDRSHQKAECQYHEGSQ
jgi:hypothetical protein